MKISEKNGHVLRFLEQISEVQMDLELLCPLRLLLCNLLYKKYMYLNKVIVLTKTYIIFFVSCLQWSF